MRHLLGCWAFKRALDCRGSFRVCPALSFTIVDLNRSDHGQSHLLDKSSHSRVRLLWISETKDNREIFLTKRKKSKSFTCSEYFDYPTSCFPSTWLIWLFWYRWTAVYQKSFYPVTGLVIRWTAVYQNSFYPVTLVPVHCFLCMCSMLILNSPKYMELYSTLTHMCE